MILSRSLSIRYTLISFVSEKEHKQQFLHQPLSCWSTFHRVVTSSAKKVYVVTAKWLPVTRNLQFPKIKLNKWHHKQVSQHRNASSSSWQGWKHCQAMSYSTVKNKSTLSSVTRKIQTTHGIQTQRLHHWRQQIRTNVSSWKSEWTKTKTLIMLKELWDAQSSSAGASATHPNDIWDPTAYQIGE